MKALVGRLQIRGFKSALFYPLVLSLSLFTTGCLTEGAGSEAGTDVVADPSDTAPPLTSPDRTVCDPFSVGQTARDRGLIGNLVYLTDDQPRYSRVSDYIENGTPIQSTLYFDKLFVPTRAFDLGFYTQDGTLILNNNSQPIYEYFGLRLETQLMIGAGQEPGWYQMSTLADDGALVSQINTDGSKTVLVNNDGTHATKMACASKAVYMDHNTKIPALIEYYQGPRYHISLVVMWRKLAEGEDPNAPAMDTECGKSGNTRFFNSNVVPSAPTTTYYDMLTRGWKPLDNENYFFPEQARNPCATEAPLLLTGFSINSSTRTQVTVSWVTSIPSSSRAEVKNVTTGAIITSPTDPVLKTNHSVTITGLSANTLYSVKGISVTAGGQSASSSESAFRTPR